MVIEFLGNCRVCRKAAPAAWICLALALLVAAPLAAQAGDNPPAPSLQPVKPPITTQNWLNHPAIVEIRALFTQTEAGIKAHDLMRIPGSSEDLAWWGLDERHIRKCSQQLGGEDSAASFDRYYDPLGTLRFVFVRANAVNGTKVEYRIYYDNQGRRIWLDRKQIAGPGYPFGDYPDEWLATPPLDLAVSGD